MRKMKRTEDRTMYELETCPFCGLPAEFYQSAYGTDSDSKAVLIRFYVGCTHCSIFPPGSEGKVVFNMGKDGNLKLLIDERGKAADVWNRRPGK